MKKTVFIILLLSLMACNPERRKSGESIIEVAVYSVKKEYIAGYPETTKQTRNLLEGIKGFRSIRTMASTEKPGVYIDQCEWDTLEDATAAAEAVQKMPEFKPIFAMMDSVIYFDHLKPVDAR